MSNSISEYQIDENEILRKAYRLLAYVLANEQIARFVHPEEPSHPLKILEGRFFWKETSGLLLEIAILFRSLDDQIKNSTNEILQKSYLERVRETNAKYGFDMFGKISIRECCNKVIHATTFEPLLVEGGDAHTHDCAAYYEGHPREIEWHYFSGDIRISGMNKNQPWAYLINIAEFVEALSYLLGDVMKVDVSHKAR